MIRLSNTRASFFLLLLILVSGSKFVFADERPNILFIYTDDQAPTAGSAFGTPELKTPNIDRLVREGVYLTNSFVTTPVCSPARASLMTSRYGTEVKITDWIDPTTESEIGLDPQFATWVKLLKESGYKTGLVGKWHLGTAEKFHPTKFGYDEFMGFREGGTKPKNPILEIDGITKKRKGFTTNILTNYAIKFIERNKAQPFMLSLHYRAPHSAWLPTPPEDWKPYELLDPKIPSYPDLNIKKVKKQTREYYASVSGVDRNVGRLLKTLDNLKLAKNTIVIFTSDHGYNLGHHGLWYKGNARWMLNKTPKKRLKNMPAHVRPNLFDQSLRVPTVVRWTSTFKPGIKMNQVVTALDWFPTLLAMAKVKQPENILVRGRNMLPLLLGKKIKWNNSFYSEYSLHYEGKVHLRGYRTPKWKLIIDYMHKGNNELYDLKADPDETTNLIDSKKKRAIAARQTLTKNIESIMQKINDPVLLNKVL